MSRSYRKNLWITDGQGGPSQGWKKCRGVKWSKRQANKRIRRTPNISDGKQYRKFYEYWDIRDYKYQYDPNPWVYISHYSGEMELVQPDPIYKYRNK